MGKSLGNTLDPEALVAGYGADAVRYYFMRRVLFG
jgi:methionyl-tRNA synthetase